MTPIEKVIFLQKSYNLNDYQFCLKFKIHHSLLKKWKDGEIAPDKKHLLHLCSNLGLDPDDFMSSDSTLKKSDISSKIHLCKTIQTMLDEEITNFEDFPREDNSRYEEKD